MSSRSTRAMVTPWQQVPMRCMLNLGISRHHRVVVLFWTPTSGKVNWKLLERASDLAGLDHLSAEMPKKMAEMIEQYETGFQETVHVDAYAMFQRNSTRR